MRQIILVTFEGAMTLDVAGPADVFAAAARKSGTPAYRVQFVSAGGGARNTTSGLRLETQSLQQLRVGRRDTVIVAGGNEEGVRAAMADQGLLTWLRRATQSAERMASVCSGAFVLAAAGLLEGRRATTHWQACERLAAMFPRVSVEQNAIFIRDGNVWTSAGVSTGIDMALAMVEEDLGRDIADAVAAALVLYIRRPGFQSQFSPALVSQLESSNPLGAAINWIRNHLAVADVPNLARATGMSVRTLHRRCRDAYGVTPAKLIERLRVEHARTLLASGKAGAKDLAARSGFATATNMKRAFERELGIAPRDYRLLHARRAE